MTGTATMRNITSMIRTKPTKLSCGGSVMSLSLSGKCVRLLLYNRQPTDSGTRVSHPSKCAAWCWEVVFLILAPLRPSTQYVRLDDHLTFPCAMKSRASWRNPGHGPTSPRQVDDRLRRVPKPPRAQRRPAIVCGDFRNGGSHEFIRRQSLGVQLRISTTEIDAVQVRLMIAAELPNRGLAEPVDAAGVRPATLSPTSRRKPSRR